MTNDDKIRDEKLQYNINREAAKISALSSGKIDKYGCFSGEEILPSHQRRVIEQTNFTYYSPKEYWLKPIKMIIKIIINKYINNWLKKDLMKWKK